MTRELIIVFARTPEHGKVKTRIAKSVGSDEALRIYIKLLQFTENLLATIKKEKLLMLSSITDYQFWEGVPQSLQIGNNLGEIIINACSSTITKAATHCIIIGTDCTELTSEIINDAFAKLNKYDVVIGPAKDGGYYLIGFNNFYPQLFQNISWGTDIAFAETLDIAKKLQLTFAILPELNDVDEVADIPKDWLNPN